MTTTIELSREERDAIRTEEKKLRACSVKWLRDELCRHRRVIDMKEMTKTDTVFEILRCQFGSKRVAAAYQKFTAQEVAYFTGSAWKRRVIKTEKAFDKFCDKMEEDGREWHCRNAE